MDNPHNLQRFIQAQGQVIDTVLAELHAGKKRTHWIWYIFPQLAGLGYSETAKRYGISGLDEARAFMADPILGPRLTACSSILLSLDRGSITDILGAPDDLKFQSCMTLFAAASSLQPVFDQCLQKYFAGEPDRMTLAKLASTSN